MDTVTEKPVWGLVAEPRMVGPVGTLMPHRVEKFLDCLVRTDTNSYESMFVIDNGYEQSLRIEMGRQAFCRVCTSGRVCKFWKVRRSLRFAIRMPRDLGPPPPNFEEMFDNAAEVFAGWLRQFGAGPAATAKAASVLGIAWPASEAEVLAAFKKRALERHPDRPGGTHDGFVEAVGAKECLLAELRR